MSHQLEKLQSRQRELEHSIGSALERAFYCQNTGDREMAHRSWAEWESLTLELERVRHDIGEELRRG